MNEGLTSIKKNENSKFKVQFTECKSLLHYHKVENRKLNHYKPGTICIQNVDIEVWLSHYIFACVCVKIS